MLISCAHATHLNKYKAFASQTNKTRNLQQLILIKREQVEEGQGELSANFQLWVLSIVGFSGSLPPLSLSLSSTLPCPYHNSIFWVICEGNFYVVRIFVFAFSSSSSSSSCNYNSRQTTTSNNKKNNNNNNVKPVTRLVNYTRNQQHRVRQRQTATPTHR